MTAAIFLTLATLAAAPPVTTLVDYVDIIELNHIVETHFVNGERVHFSQWIFWRWNHTGRRYEVIAWRRAGGPCQWRGTTLRFTDGETPREIRAISSRETWTLHDPEVADRQVVDTANRRGLARIAKGVTKGVSR